ncbi:MAG TPA: FAD-dependent oxidoreductase [Sphingomicrobium sp.]|nr:FAD-dependent oxidoreductase [Sphingomicrobium sp.]
MDVQQGQDRAVNGELHCDLLVVGSGGAALTAAIAARKSGLDVVVVEKQPVFGGTTATSGGMLWIPGNHLSKELQAEIGQTDSIESARKYIIDEAANYADVDRIDAYLRYGPEMIEFLERETHVRFEAARYPDYNMRHPNSSILRSLFSVEYDASHLGKHFRELKPELPQLLFLGFAIGSSVEMQQFFRAGRSIKAFAAVAAKMTRHLIHSAMFGGPRRVVRGRALITRLAQTVFELNVPILLSSPARALLRDGDTVIGAVIDGPQGERRIIARRGVVLGSGGFPYSSERRQQAYPANAWDGVNRSVANPGNTGDGARLAEEAGGVFSNDVSNAAAWMPTSLVPDISGPAGVWPHLVDRLKPGFIAITRNGRRFADESCPYSEFVPAMIEATRGDSLAYAWVIGDRNAVDRWGIGRVRPRPMPRKKFIRTGYLKEGKTIRDLAVAIEVDPNQLEETIARFNADAVRGIDSEFQRGGNVYDLYQGDDEHKPNPCLGPLDTGPFYAVKVYAGEIGTFAGIRTDKFSRVLNKDGEVVSGLYAVGNDQANVFGGAYPGAGATLGPGFTFGYVAGRHAAGALVDA